MTEPPTPFQAPDKRTLLKGTLVALAMAAVVLVLAVLPAEYGVDPTGFGRATGLTALGGADPPQPDAPGTDDGKPNFVAAGPAATYRRTFVLPAGLDLEWKFHAKEGAGFTYSWNATHAVYFDFHGDMGDGDVFTSFREDQADQSSGLFQAPFEGRHGWYWRNDAQEPVTLTLELTGYFEVIGKTGGLADAGEG